jgi:hypothetical protein
MKSVIDKDGDQKLPNHILDRLALAREAAMKTFRETWA